MKPGRTLACIATAGAFSGAAHAAFLSGTFTVDSLISEPSTAGFTSLEGFSMCSFGVMYIDTATEAGKAQFAMITSAKAAGWKVTGINYTIEGTDTCRVQSLYVK